MAASITLRDPTLLGHRARGATLCEPLAIGGDGRCSGWSEASAHAS
jgi:hypothetical protein